jgi:hypothetical protein
MITYEKYSQTGRQPPSGERGAANGKYHDEAYQVTRLTLDGGPAPPLVGAPGGGALEVAFDSLDQTAAGLHRTTQTVAEFSGRGTGWSGLAVEAGDAGMTAAIESFVHRWNYGLTCLHSDVESLSRAVRAAADAYRSIEAAIVAGYRG